MSHSIPSRQQRALDAMRPVRLTRGYTIHAEGSVLIEFGNTRVLCTALALDVLDLIRISGGIHHHGAYLQLGLKVREQRGCNVGGRRVGGPGQRIKDHRMTALRFEMGHLRLRRQ